MYVTSIDNLTVVVGACRWLCEYELAVFIRLLSRWGWNPLFGPVGGRLLPTLPKFWVSRGALTWPWRARGVWPYGVDAGGMAGSSP